MSVEAQVVIEQQRDMARLAELERAARESPTWASRVREKLQKARKVDWAPIIERAEVRIEETASAGSTAFHLSFLGLPPHADGSELCRRLGEKHPDMKFIYTSVHGIDIVNFE
jgi:hypothetical protein